MRRPLASLALLALAASIVFTLFGCAHKLTGTISGNKPPHTVLWVQGPVDTVNHLVHMYWFGTDQDGYVRSYQLKLVNPEDTVAADSGWFTTTRTDSVFGIFTPQGHAHPTLYVRAVDNLGALDPHPAIETFDFRNRAPVITWKSIPSLGDKSDTSFASVSVSWNTSDPDGDLTKVTYRLWLDGNDATPDVITGTQSFTVPSARFLQNGQWTNGTRTLFVQAIDDGGMASNTLSIPFYVRMPVANPDYTPGHRPGRLLIVDEVPAKSGQSEFLPNYVDTIYTNTAQRNLPNGSWNVLHIDFNQPFRTSQDLAQTLKLFDTVVWYRGSQDSLWTLMRNFEPGVRSYLDSGGSIYLESVNLVDGNNALGALSMDFVRTYLDCYGLFSHIISSTTPDSSQGWGLKGFALLQSDAYGDTVSLNTSSSNNVRVFDVKQASDVLFAVRHDTKLSGGTTGGLTPDAPDSLPGPPVPVGISVTTPAGGRAIILAAPIAYAQPKSNNHISRIMARIFADLGLIH